MKASPDRNSWNIAVSCKRPGPQYHCLLLPINCYCPSLPQPTLLTVMLELHCSLCNPSGKCAAMLAHEGPAHSTRPKQSVRAWLIPDLQKHSSAKLETIHKMMWTASRFQNLQPYICSHIASNSPGIYWGGKGRQKELLIRNGYRMNFRIHSWRWKKHITKEVC